MELPSDFRDALIEARKMSMQGRLLEAERIYRTLAAPGPHRGIALEALAELYLHQQRLDEAHSTLRALTEHDPDSLHYCALLANFLDSVGRTQTAVGEYLRLIERQPGIAVAHFNLALLYKKQKRHAEALAAYEEALRLEIDQPEEVYSNMGILYSDMQDEDNARKMYERALEVSPDYVPALYNLAGHYEEVNDKERAVEQYEYILSVNPRHWDSLARLMYPRKITSEHQALVDKLQNAVKETKDDNVTTERLNFALGKAFDDLKQYDKASAAYAAANDLGKLRVVPYDQEKTAAAFDKLIELFDEQWVRDNASSSTAEPIFIVGMFRSGSTLLERMLGAHPSITAGGELDFLPWLVGSELAPFPEGIKAASSSLLQRVGEEYLFRVKEMFPEADKVTDKRPDNFLQLGLIKALFPAARIIHTRRFILDNCLSLYFQQLGNNFSYATDLEDCVHYYQQQQRLMAHWTSLFGSDIYAVDYEELVVSPEPVLRALLEYLGLEWDAGVLEFKKSGTPVKTPSLWQVREDLHTRSSGRWHNYKALLGKLTELAPAGDAPPA